MLRYFFVFFIVTYSSFGVSGEYPVPSDVKTIISQDGQWVGFDVQWRTVMLGGDTDLRPELNRSNVYIVFQDKRGMFQKVGSCSTALCKNPRDSSKGELAMNFYHSGIQNKTSHFRLSGYDGGCIAIGFGSIGEGQAGDGQVPNGGCVSTPPIDVYCEIKSDNISIAHGELQQGSGVNKANQSFIVNCISNTSVSFSFLDNKLTLSNGVLSNLNILGGGRKRLNAGDNNVTIESVIDVGSSAKAGIGIGITALTLAYD